MSESPKARFVVGTSRCGSTLLSRMLSQNERALSVFEFFSGIDSFFRFRTDPVAGDELAARLSEDHPMLTMVLKRGHDVPEVVYPFGAPGMRYDRGDRIPWTLAIALARISDTPDALFDEMLAFASSRPVQKLSVHYREILEFLTQRTGKSFWIERSGSSIEFIGVFKEFFPEARFVHLHRDGREAALSMREYTVLRLAVAVMNGLLGDHEYSHDGLEALERRDPEAIDRMIASRPPIELFGRYWSQQIEDGAKAREGLDPSDIFDVRFEDLVTKPEPTLRDIADFLEIERDGGWMEAAVGLVKGLPPTRFESLTVDEQRRLEAACRPAMELLGRRL